MRRTRQFLIVIIGVLALSACGRSKLDSLATPMPVALPTASVAIATTASSAVALVATVAATPVQDVVTATAARSVSSAGATVRVTAAAQTPTPLATQTRPPTSQPAAQPTAVPPTATAGVPRVTQVPATAPKQAVGTTTDGLVLLNVRTGTHDGFTRLVFDFSKADGSAAPVPRCQVWTQDGAVIVMIVGIRNDQFGQTLGNGVQAVNEGSVIGLYRIPSFDDASVAYGISTKGAAGVTLTTAVAPARLIVDIAD